MRVNVRRAASIFTSRGNNLSIVPTFRGVFREGCRKVDNLLGEFTRDLQDVQSTTTTRCGGANLCRKMNCISQITGLL